MSEERLILSFFLITDMGKISLTKRQAYQEACKMAKEGKKRQDIVNHLVATYLYPQSESYTLANAALSTIVKEPPLNKVEFPEKEVVDEKE